MQMPLRRAAHQFIISPQAINELFLAQRFLLIKNVGKIKNFKKRVFLF